MWLTEADLLIWTKQTPQQDAKLNNAAQDDEQHNTMPHSNDEITTKTQEKTWYMWKSLI